MQLPLPPSSTGETGHTGEQVLQQADGDPHFNLVISNHIWHKRKSNRNRNDENRTRKTWRLHLCSPATNLSTTTHGSKRWFHSIARGRGKEAAMRHGKESR
jgi:hypothetical protein